MAVPKKRGDVWQAKVSRNGPRISRSFATKAAAEAWRVQEEAKRASMTRGDVPPGITFGQLLERYRDEVAAHKRGEKWETTRINMFLREDEIVRVHLTALDSAHVAAWRDRRLKAVQGSSVKREWTILSHACTIAINDWKWLHHNPFKEATRPEGNPSRTRRPESRETATLLHVLGCDPQVTPVTKTARVGFAYLFALATAMREGEIAELLWSDIKGKVAFLRKTKNGEEREVPLFKEALRLLPLLPRPSDGDALVFQLTAAQIDSLFRNAKKKALVEGLHFHDTRREALTWMATPKARGGKGIDVLTLAKISGHRDLRILLNTYYRPDMQDVAESFG